MFPFVIFLVPDVLKNHNRYYVYIMISKNIYPTRDQVLCGGGFFKYAEKIFEVYINNCPEPNQTDNKVRNDKRQGDHYVKHAVKYFFFDI